MPQNANLATKNYLHQSYGDIIQRFEKQLHFFRTVKKVQKIVVQWECHYKKKFPHMSKDREAFNQTLAPRAALRGGKVENWSNMP